MKADVVDSDGTLVDSVDLHASALREAFARFGHDVTFDLARSQIGKGSDQLLPVFFLQRSNTIMATRWRE